MVQDLRKFHLCNGGGARVYTKCYFLEYAINYLFLRVLTLFRMGLFGAAHG